MAAFLFFALSGLFSHCFDGVHRGGAYRREQSGDTAAECCDERERDCQPPSRQQKRSAEPQRAPRERKTGGSAGCAEQPNRLSASAPAKNRERACFFI